jgi:hypothetical protein
MLCQHHNLKCFFDKFCLLVNWNVFEVAYKLQMVFNCQIFEQYIELLAKSKILLYGINI